MSDHYVENEFVHLTLAGFILVVSFCFLFQLLKSRFLMSKKQRFCFASFYFGLVQFGFPSVLRTLPGLNRTVLEAESPRNYFIVESALKRSITISPVEPESALETYYQPFLTCQTTDNQDIDILGG